MATKSTLAVTYNMTGFSFHNCDRKFLKTFIHQLKPFPDFE